MLLVGWLVVQEAGVLMDRVKELKHLIYLETKQIDECKRNSLFYTLIKKSVSKRNIKRYKDELDSLEPRRYKKEKGRKVR